MFLLATLLILRHVYNIFLLKVNPRFVLCGPFETPYIAPRDNDQNAET